MSETGTEQKPQTNELAASSPKEAPDVGAQIVQSAPGVTDMWAVGAEKGYEHLLKVADIFSHSGLVPDRYRCKCRKHGEDCTCGAVNDCAIVTAMALKHRADILGFMQKVYVVHGTPGMEAQLAIALANTSGVWKAPIAYKWSGTEGAADRKCTAWAVDAKSNEYCERSCSMEDAERMGWTKPVKLKGGGTMPSKWITMSEDMLVYRSSMKLMRTYHPEILLGMSTVDELREIGPRDVEVQVIDDTKSAIAEKVDSARRGIAAPSAEDEKPISEVMKDAARLETDSKTQAKPEEQPQAETAKEAPKANGKQESLLEQPKTTANPEGKPIGIKDLLAADLSSMSDKEMREHRIQLVPQYEDLCQAANAEPLDIKTTRTTTIMEHCRKLLEELKQG